MSVEATMVGQLTVVETLDSNVPAAAPVRARVTHDQFNWAQTLKADSTPAASKVAAFTKALVSGAGQLDLTALVGTNSVTVNGNGLHVRGLQIVAPANNAGAVTITPAESDGYNLFGAADSKVAIAPGDQLTMFCKAAQSVASNAKFVDLAGTGTDSLKIILLLG